MLGVAADCPTGISFGHRAEAQPCIVLFVMISTDFIVVGRWRRKERVARLETPPARAARRGSTLGGHPEFERLDAVPALKDALIYSQIDGPDSSMTCENRRTES